MSEATSAEYPRTIAVVDAVNVMPEKSRSIASTTIEIVPILDFKICFQSSPVRLEGLWGTVMFDAIAVNRTSPVRIPPICVEA